MDEGTSVDRERDNDEGNRRTRRARKWGDSMPGGGGGGNQGRRRDEVALLLSKALQSA